VHKLENHIGTCYITPPEREEREREDKREREREREREKRERLFKTFR